MFMMGPVTAWELWIEIGKAYPQGVPDVPK
jgi:hypothetical protein